MNWQTLLRPDIKAFIRKNEQHDVAALGLKASPDKSWPYSLILAQIKAHQKARLKIPSWLSHEDIVLPAADILEQASSAATACYKARLCKGRVFADLTSGAGVDSWAFLEHFESALCVERNETAAALIAHNLHLLSAKKIEIFEGQAEEFVKTMPAVDMIYLDPQRRNDARKGFYRLEDCSPDIFELLSFLKEKTNLVMLKTSPMLDIAKTLNDLPNVAHVHVVEWRGECREVLYILDFNSKTELENIPVTAVEIDDHGLILHDLTFTNAEEKESTASFSMPGDFLYEPGPAFQKAGAFNLLAQKYNLKKLHAHTHLYTSDAFCETFPGRRFKVLNILPVDAKTIGITQAHLSIRNFPGEVPALRKKLKLKDGGEDYLFACTLMDGRKALIHSRKAI